MVLAVALGSLSCTSSNNSGRIVGKWKITELSPEQAARMKWPLKFGDTFGLAAFYEFREDGTFSRGMWFKTAEMEKFVQGLAKRELVSKGRYRLLEGDGVELSDLDADDLFGRGGAKQTVRVTITDDAMKLTDGQGTLTLARSVEPHWR